MTRILLVPAVPATFLLAFALLLAALPVRAEGLPSLDPNPSIPGFDCGGGDAGNSYESPSWIREGAVCTGTLAPLVDEEDWYGFWAWEGTQGYASVVGYSGDVELCLFGPSSNATPLACSTEPLFTYDSVDFVAPEHGTYRLQVRLAAGAGLYFLHLSTYPPQPYYLPDVAVLQLRAEKPVLRTDAVEAGVNPVGAWKLTAELTNLGAHSYACPEVWFFIQGEPLLPNVILPPYLFGGPGASASVQTEAPCLGPGQTAEVSVDWRPLWMVGDVEITAVAYTDWDADWENNHRRIRDFVLVGGL